MSEVNWIVERGGQHCQHTSLTDSVADLRSAGAVEKRRALRATARLVRYMMGEVGVACLSKVLVK